MIRLRVRVRVRVRLRLRLRVRPNPTPNLEHERGAPRRALGVGIARTGVEVGRQTC